jgi:hypothetical protein
MRALMRSFVACVGCEVTTAMAYWHNALLAVASMDSRRKSITTICADTDLTNAKNTKNA